MQVNKGSPRKNPYLTQFKSNFASSQNEANNLRKPLQGLSQPTDASRNLRKDYSRESFPSIDDDNNQQQPQQTQQKSRYSYFEDEAEASLQYFKKNLLPSSKSLYDQQDTPTKSHTVERHEVRYSTKPNEKPADSLNNYKTKSQTLFADDDKLESSKYKPSKTASTRPVPFKQESDKQQIDTERRPTAASDTKPKQSLDYFRQSSQPSRRGLDKVAPAEENTKIISNNINGNNNNYIKSSENNRKTLNSDKQPPIQNKPANRNSYESSANRKFGSPAESPIPIDGFSRKPLYNSLLRAHDSIRLKVNRPNIRPKSEVVVNDTEIDNTLELVDINPSESEANERAVDVKRSSSKRKSKSKGSKSKDKEKNSEENQIPVKNFADVRIVKVVRNENERSLGVTVKAEDGNIVVARIMAGSLADKQGALQVGDIILAVNNREVYTPEQLQEQLSKSINEEAVLLKIVPSFREELPTLCIYVRALFNYDANEDSLLPCKEVGVSFNQGDILEVVNQEDPNWWQARRVDSENLQTGLIPSQDLEERRRAFVIPDYDLATRTSICGTRVARKSKKKEIYNLGQNCDFDKAEIQLYEEVCRTPAFERRTLVLIGANGVGKQAFKARLVASDPERFGTPLPHTSRLPREGEEDGVHYHFVTREKMEEDIINGKYLEFGEYDGALYGTMLDSVREIIGSGRVCVLDCSPTCLKLLKTSDYLPFVAFIAAPTLDQLRFMNDWSRGNKTYATFDRALSRQSRRAKTLHDFAFDFFEDEDLQLTIEESARLFRMYENYCDIVLVNNHFERTFEQLREAIDALSMAPQWIPISWIYGT